MYDLGDPVNRDDLVKDLVNTLSTGKPAEEIARLNKLISNLSTGKTKKFTDVKVDNESEVLFFLVFALSMKAHLQCSAITGAS